MDFGWVRPGVGLGKSKCYCILCEFDLIINNNDDGNWKATREDELSKRQVALFLFPDVVFFSCVFILKFD